MRECLDFSVCMSVLKGEPSLSNLVKILFRSLGSKLKHKLASLDIIVSNLLTVLIRFFARREGRERGERQGIV